MKLGSLFSSTASSKNMKIAVPKMQLVPAASLFVSEPNPYMFDNPSNRKTEHWTNSNWLKSRFHFSFAEYRDPNNSSFGELRVMNDDLVQPSRGFGAHPHSNMEIVTYVVDGELTHEDSTGNKESLGRGSVQYMTAGTGLYHSERNESVNNPYRFIQMWINPRRKGLKVNYGSYRGISESQIDPSSGTEDEQKNAWKHLVSDVKSNHSTPVQIHQDANIFVSEASSGSELRYSIKQNRIGYLLVVESDGGMTKVAGSVENSAASGSEEVEMSKHEALKIFGPKEITISPPNTENGKAHVLLVEMPKK